MVVDNKKKKELARRERSPKRKWVDGMRDLLMTRGLKMREEIESSWGMQWDGR